MSPSPVAKRLGLSLSVFVAIVAVSAGLLFIRQNYRYYRELRRPDHASFAELATALRAVIPAGVCPVSIERPVIWLAFPECDRCYASLEGRMGDPVDIVGNEFALIAAPGRQSDWVKALSSNIHFLGELDDTPYGNLLIYYTGNNPAYSGATPKRFRFSGNKAGNTLE
jgi:hypothetical protein